MNKNLPDTNSYEKTINNNDIKNYIKLILTLQPNTLEGTKLLTITLIDYSEILNEYQLKEIVQFLFNNLNSTLQKENPISKNCESIIINANINIVYFFWANWRTHLCGPEIVKDIKFNGDPKIVGNTLELTYLNKYRLGISNGQGEDLNNVFVSCENGSKTWVSVENDINEKIGIDKLQELSKRKLMILKSMKNYIENNIDFLKSLGNDKYCF